MDSAFTSLDDTSEALQGRALIDATELHRYLVSVRLSGLRDLHCRAHPGLAFDARGGVEARGGTMSTRGRTAALANLAPLGAVLRHAAGPASVGAAPANPGPSSSTPASVTRTVEC
jgi:hypothetical protein